MYLIWLLIAVTAFQAIRIAVFAEGADAEEAKAAGADVVGGLELIDEIASKQSILSMYIALMQEK